MADVLTFSGTYLAKNRKRIMEDIAYAQYKVGSSWYRADIEDVRILQDGRIEVTFEIDHTVAGNITVKEIALYDFNSSLIASKTVSITRQDATEGILYVCWLSLFQVVPNADNTGAYDTL